jgi:predicted O-linked N-acetylglucosamine transferase (SPINDLY family)
MFESHDRSRFEVFLYSTGKDDGSEMRSRIRSAAEHFIDCSRTRAADLAKRVRDDEIDILVDLKGYTYDSMPELFAYRSAPVQVAYLGFPGTSGANFIDYMIGDRWVTPLEDSAHFSEKIAQLPNCYQCNDGSRPLPVTPDRRSQGLPDDAVVLCGFNQPYKISPDVFDVWCRLLHRIPESVLWLLEWHPQAPPALRREAEARGIDPQRLVFAPSVLQKDHLDRIGCADLFLDTWPCNGHTTASDMLWAGVPVVTFSGKTFASRVAGSLLQAVGVTETICSSVEDYEAKAFALAADPVQRRDIRDRIMAARLESTLFDGGLITRDIESLYERMWQRAVDGLPADHLPASTAR